MKKFNAPNLKGPRYRLEHFSMMKKDLFERFKKKFPQYKDLDIATFQKIINVDNGLLWQSVIDGRDGIELRNSLGYIFIGSCKIKKLKVTDIAKSIACGVRVLHKNWESDNYTAKIFYSNSDQKYRLQNRDLWAFSAVRQFRRSVAKTYPVEWKKYIVVEENNQIARAFKKIRVRQYMMKQSEKLLIDYDEFNLD